MTLRSFTEKDEARPPLIPHGPELMKGFELRRIKTRAPKSTSLSAVRGRRCCSSTAIR